MAEETKTNEDKVEDKVEVKTDKVETQSDEDESLETEAKGFEASPEEQIFITALRDPKQQKQVIALLASQQGLKLTDQEVKKGEPSLGDELKAVLGDDFGFLGPEIGKVIGKRLGALEQKLSQEIDGVKSEASGKELSRAENTFFREHPDSKKFHQKMIAKSRVYPPPAGMDSTEYIEDLYTLVSGQVAGKSIADAQRQKRIIKNKEATESDVASSGPDEGNFQEVTGPVSARQAVEAAVKGINLVSKG